MDLVLTPGLHYWSLTSPFRLGQSAFDPAPPSWTPPSHDLCSQGCLWSSYPSESLLLGKYEVLQITSPHWLWHLWQDIAIRAHQEPSGVLSGCLLLSVIPHPTGRKAAFPCCCFGPWGLNTLWLLLLAGVMPELRSLSQLFADKPVLGDEICF